MASIARTGARREMRAGLVDSLPLVCTGMIPFGLLIGVVARQIDLTFTETMLIAIFVFAGKAQLAAFGLLVVGAGIGEIILAVFAINSRFLPMSISLGPHLRDTSIPARIYLAHLIGDQSYALAMPRLINREQGVVYYAAVGSALYVGSVISTIFGYWLGFSIDAHKWGLDFAIVAASIALLLPLIVKRSHWAAMIVGATTMMLTGLLGGGQGYVWVPAVAAGTVGALWRWND